MNLVLGSSLNKEMMCSAKDKSGFLIRMTKGSKDWIILVLKTNTLSMTKCRDLKMSNLGFF